MQSLYSPVQLQKRVAELGAQITADFTGEPELTVVVLLNGALLFGADLVRQIALPMHIDTLAVSSYAGQSSCGVLTFRAQLKNSVKGRAVLLVDDIFDTGLTLGKVREYLLEQGAKSVKSCVLLNKVGPQKQSALPNYIGFDAPEHFLIGYGLDADERYRNLPGISFLDDNN